MDVGSEGVSVVVGCGGGEVIVVVVVVVGCCVLSSDVLVLPPLVVACSCAGTAGTGGRISLNPGIAILELASFPDEFSEANDGGSGGGGIC